jgi:hypothetical protein
MNLDKKWVGPYFGLYFELYFGYSHAWLEIILFLTCGAEAKSIGLCDFELH